MNESSSFGFELITWRSAEECAREFHERDRHPEQDVARRLVCPQAVLRLHALDHEPTETAEIPFNEAAFDMDQLLYLLANYRGRCERADQRARNNPGDRNASKASRSSTRLSDAGRVQGNVRVPLIASFKVPIRLVVPQEVEGGASESW